MILQYTKHRDLLFKTHKRRIIVRQHKTINGQKDWKLQELGRRRKVQGQVQLINPTQTRNANKPPHKVPKKLGEAF